VLLPDIVLVADAVLAMEGLGFGQ